MNDFRWYSNAIGNAMKEVVVLLDIQLPALTLKPDGEGADTMMAVCQQGMPSGYTVLEAYPHKIHRFWKILVKQVEDLPEEEYIRWTVFHEAAHFYQNQHIEMISSAGLPRELYDVHPGELLADAFANQWVAPLRPVCHYPLLQVAGAYAVKRDRWPQRILLEECRIYSQFAQYVQDFLTDQCLHLEETPAAPECLNQHRPQW